MKKKMFLGLTWLLGYRLFVQYFPYLWLSKQMKDEPSGSKNKT